MTPPARVCRPAFLVALLMPVLLLAAEPPSTPGAARPKAGSRTSTGAATDGPMIIELHKGIPGVAFIGQTLQALRAKFPAAQVTPFAKQNDVATVSIPEAGISCQIGGQPPDDYRVMSIGFNLSGAYQSFAEGKFRTDKGIGKGSTVNDLLGAYGRPTRIKARRPPAEDRPPPAPVDPGPSHYIYDNADGSVATDFVVDGDQVARVVINDLAPLRKFLLRGGPGG